MSLSVYERVLGAELDRLPPSLRACFAGGAAGGVGEGVFTSAGCTRRLLRPLLRVLARQRILFPEFGTDVPFRIVNTPTVDGGVHAVRTFRFPAGDRPLEDTLRVVDGHLHDVMGRRGGFEVRMLLAVEGERLLMRSERQWLHVGPLRLRLPRLAGVIVTESVVDGRRAIDVRLRSPLLGEWFRYAGAFDCSTMRCRGGQSPCIRIATNEREDAIRNRSQLSAATILTPMPVVGAEPGGLPWRRPSPRWWR